MATKRSGVLRQAVQCPRQMKPSITNLHDGQEHMFPEYHSKRTHAVEMTTSEDWNGMKQTTKNLDSLHHIHDSLNGTGTLLFGLASYDGVELDVEETLNNKVADILKDDRIALRSVLNGCRPKTPQHVTNEKLPAKQ